LACAPQRCKPARCDPTMRAGPIRRAKARPGEDAANLALKQTWPQKNLALKNLALKKCGPGQTRRLTGTAGRLICDGGPDQTQMQATSAVLRDGDRKVIHRLVAAGLPCAPRDQAFRTACDRRQIRSAPRSCRKAASPCDCFRGSANTRADNRRAVPARRRH